MATWEEQAPCVSAGAPLPNASGNFSSWGDKVHTNPSALSALLPPALQGTETSCANSHVAPPCKIFVSILTEQRSCMQVYVSSSDQVGPEKESDWWWASPVFFSGEDFFTKSVLISEYTVGSPNGEPSPLSLHSNVPGHTVFTEAKTLLLKLKLLKKK